MSVPPRRATPALLQVDAVLQRLGGADALTEVCRYLRQEFSHFDWVGVYRKDGERLRLAGWNGAAETEHTVIALDRGVCGRAARENRTVVVDDVRAAPEYLACFVDTRAEIVVPVRDRSGGVLGEIDIDGTSVGAFDASDAAFLESVAAKIAPVLEGPAPRS